MGDAGAVPASTLKTMISASAILSVAPAAKKYVYQLLPQMRRAEIDVNDQRVAHFLAQTHHESQGFTRVVENLNYSADRLRRMFSRKRISAEDCERYGRTKDHPANPRMLANILYGGEFGRRMLGNTEPDDGWRFRGRGLIQVTGRANYRAFSLWWRGDESVLREPEVLEQPHGAVASAVWFWTTRRLNRIADHASVERVTRAVNGGLNGVKERKALFERYLRALQTDRG